eukprot:11171011-Lingulodinium_polyedra.AAC.1
MMRDQRACDLDRRWRGTLRPPSLVGLDPRGGFRTTPASAYPRELCQCLAAAALRAVAAARHEGRPCPLEPGPPWDPPRGRGGFLAGGLAAGLAGSLRARGGALFN